MCCQYNFFCHGTSPYPVLFFKHFCVIFNDDNRRLLGRIAKGIVDEDPSDFLRIDALAVAEDSRALEVVDVSDDGTVAAMRCLIFSATLSGSAGP